MSHTEFCDGLHDKERKMMDGWTDVWMHGWIDEWIEGWMDGWIR
jgi:hypothetical protein